MTPGLSVDLFRTTGGLEFAKFGTTGTPADRASLGSDSQEQLRLGQQTAVERHGNRLNLATIGSGGALGRQRREPILQIHRVPHRVGEAGVGCPGITEVQADQGTDRIERRTRGGIETEGVFREVAHTVAV